MQRVTSHCMMSDYEIVYVGTCSNGKDQKLHFYAGKAKDNHLTSHLCSCKSNCKSMNKRCFLKHYALLYVTRCA